MTYISAGTHNLVVLWALLSVQLLWVHTGHWVSQTSLGLQLLQGHWAYLTSLGPLFGVTGAKCPIGLHSQNRSNHSFDNFPLWQPALWAFWSELRFINQSRIEQNLRSHIKWVVSFCTCVHFTLNLLRINSRGRIHKIEEVWRKVRVKPWEQWKSVDWTSSHSLPTPTATPFHFPTVPPRRTYFLECTPLASTFCFASSSRHFYSGWSLAVSR